MPRHLMSGTLYCGPHYSVLLGEYLNKVSCSTLMHWQAHPVSATCRLTHLTFACSRAICSTLSRFCFPAATLSNLNLRHGLNSIAHVKCNRASLPNGL